MEIKIHDISDSKIAELITTKILSSTDDFINVIGNTYYIGVDKIIIHKQNIHPDFFDLKTRMAGDVLQKISTYRLQLAIVGDFSKYTSKNLHDFIRESNRVKRVLFVNSIFKAIEKL